MNNKIQNAFDFLILGSAVSWCSKRIKMIGLL